MRKILVVEDNPDVSELLSLHLSDEGYEVSVVHDGQEGLISALSHKHDMVILDLMLPSMPGLEICRRIRADDIYTPILILTAKSTELDRVVGLEIGGDDYITKPFSIRELLARTKALLRRVEAFQNAPRDPVEQIQNDELTIELSKRKVQLGDRPINLTAREFDLLVHFARNPGRVYSRTELLELVWGYGHRGYDHTVNTHINRLRSKLETDPSNPQIILTVWGVGYKFRETNDRAELS